MPQASNSQKTPMAVTLNRLAAKRAHDLIKVTGRSLPASVVSASGAIVTVKFEVNAQNFTLPHVTMPAWCGAQWLRIPYQAGDKGFVIPADARLAGISGLGGGVADLSTPANLAALMFMPLGVKSFPSVDPNAVVLGGPNGVVLQDENKLCTFTLTPTGIIIKIGAVTVTIDASGIKVVGGDVKADTIDLKTHVHSDVQTGSSNTGEPVA